MNFGKKSSFFGWNRLETLWILYFLPFLQLLQTVWTSLKVLLIVVFPSLSRHTEEEMLINESQKEGMKFSLKFQALYGDECDHFMDSSLMDAVNMMNLINRRSWFPVLNKSHCWYICHHHFMKMRRNTKSKVGFNFFTVDCYQTLKWWKFWNPISCVGDVTWHLPMAILLYISKSLLLVNRWWKWIFLFVNFQ